MQPVGAVLKTTTITLADNKISMNIYTIFALISNAISLKTNH